MNRWLLAFVLGLVVGAIIRNRASDTTTRRRYAAVRAAEAGGNVDRGIAWGEL